MGVNLGVNFSGQEVRTLRLTRRLGESRYSVVNQLVVLWTWRFTSAISALSARLGNLTTVGTRRHLATSPHTPEEWLA